MARELYYLVETIYTATAANDTPNACQMWIHGKGDEVLFADTKDGICDTNKLTPYFVREYGYKRACDAKRCYSFTHPDTMSKFWTAEVRIVTAWVRKDGRVFMT